MMNASDRGPVRVYILDDHEVVRLGLRSLLTRHGLEVVGEGGTADGAAEQILSLRPDVAVLDLRLPHGSGVDVCRAVTSADPDIRVLLLTSYQEDREALFEAIAAGASGYIIKDVNNFELVTAVQTVAEGRSLIDSTMTAHILERLRARDAGRSEPGDLTEVELTVLRHIAAGQTNREIAARTGLGERVVRTHVSRVLTKLGVRSRTQAAVVAGHFLDED